MCRFFGYLDEENDEDEGKDRQKVNEYRLWFFHVVPYKKVVYPPIGIDIEEVNKVCGKTRDQEESNRLSDGFDYIRRARMRQKGYSEHRK